MSTHAVRGGSDDRNTERIRFLPDEESNQRIKDEFTGWLRQNCWGLFGTFTFASHVGQNSRHKLFGSMVNASNRDAFGRHAINWPDGGIKWFRTEERTGSGLPHFHALFHVPAGYSPSRTRATMARFWRPVGIARIEVPLCQDAVVIYVSKMIGRGAEVELSRNFPAFKVGS